MARAPAGWEGKKVMKLLDRLSLWVLSIASMLMSLLLLLLILVPGLAWLQVPGVRIGGGALALLGIAAALLLLIRCGTRKREKGEAALIDEGENGSAYVTLDVLRDMTKKVAQDTEGVRSCRTAVKRGADGVDVELELALHPGVAVAPLASLLQARLKERILEMTGIRVGKVSILVEAAAEGDKPKEPPIQLLPGGDS